MCHAITHNKPARTSIFKERALLLPHRHILAQSAMASLSALILASSVLAVLVVLGGCDVDYGSYAIEPPYGSNGPDYVFGYSSTPKPPGKTCRVKYTWANIGRSSYPHFPLLPIRVCRRINQKCELFLK